jgi:hypothetical protein
MLVAVKERKTRDVTRVLSVFDDVHPSGANKQVFVGTAALHAGLLQCSKLAIKTSSRGTRRCCAQVVSYGCCSSEGMGAARRRTLVGALQEDIRAYSLLWPPMAPT